MTDIFPMIAWPKLQHGMRGGGESAEQRSAGASWYRPAHPSLAMCVLSVGTKALYSEHWTTTTTGKFACKATLPEEDWMVGWREEGAMNACALGLGQLQLPDSGKNWYLKILKPKFQYIRHCYASQYRIFETCSTSKWVQGNLLDLGGFGRMTRGRILAYRVVCWVVSLFINSFSN